MYIKDLSIWVPVRGKKRGLGFQVNLVAGDYWSNTGRDSQAKFESQTK
jgi:hypothetical protein